VTSPARWAHCPVCGFLGGAQPPILPRWPAATSVALHRLGTTHRVRIVTLAELLAGPHACGTCEGIGTIRVRGRPGYERRVCPTCGGSGLLKPRSVS
jgi:hypothetical protein